MQYRHRRAVPRNLLTSRVSGPIHRHKWVQAGRRADSLAVVAKEDCWCIVCSCMNSVWRKRRRFSVDAGQGARQELNMCAGLVLQQKLKSCPTSSAIVDSEDEAMRARVRKCGCLVGNTVTTEGCGGCYGSGSGSRNRWREDCRRSADCSMKRE